MIVPAQRLLLAAALAALPVATVAGMAPGLAPLCGIVLLLFVAVAAADAWLGLRRVDAIEAAAPAQVRMVRDAPQTLALTLRNRAASEARPTVGLTFPEGVASDAETRVARIPASSAVLLEWPCTGVARGDHRIDAVYLQAASPLGLWEARATRAAACRLQVFPALRDPETMRLLRRAGDGPRLVRQVGKGREFEKLRDYAPGDSYEDIHWKATARRSRPVVKLYQVEHAQEVYLAIDHSRLTGREQMLEEYIGAALHVAIAAERYGDRFGMAAFSDRVHRFVRARRGRDHFRICREAIYNLQPRRVNPDFREIFAGLGAGLQKRSLVMFFTALDDPLLAETFEREVGVLARRHIVVAYSLETAATRPLFRGAPPESLDDAYRGLAGQMLHNRLRAAQLRLRNRGVAMEIVTADELKRRAAEAYLRIKRRQLL
jgi:uncharacterized protein (DUF58 family)